jgi:hypothetical protein
MKPPLILDGVALVVVGLLGAILKAFAVDEARGYVQRRVRADVEAAISALPEQLRDEWGDDCRAELAFVISTPLTAIRFAKEVRLMVCEEWVRLSREASGLYEPHELSS